MLFFLSSASFSFCSILSWDEDCFEVKFNGGKYFLSNVPIALKSREMGLVWYLLFNDIVRSAAAEIASKTTKYEYKILL